MLTASENRVIDEILNLSKEFGGLTKELQKKNLTLLNTPKLQGGRLKSSQVYGTSMALMHQLFLALCLKQLYHIQAGQVSSMTNGQRQPAHALLCDDSSDNWVQSGRRFSIVERVVKRRKVSNFKLSVHKSIRPLSFQLSTFVNVSSQLPALHLSNNGSICTLTISRHRGFCTRTRSFGSILCSSRCLVSVNR